MNRKLLLAIISLMLLTVFTSHAQSQKPELLPLAIYNDNVDKPLSIEERKMLEDVYADKLEDYVLSRPNRLKSVKNILRNRVEIIDMPFEKLAGFKNLSEIPLFNSYNSNLKRDVVVNKNNFNLLKYQFDFYSRRASFIRIDNTNKVIRIKSQNQR